MGGRLAVTMLRKAWAAARALPWSELLHQHFSKDPLKDTFIMMSHVKFLQASGARIVPVSYKLN
jgi:hypothetical protein